MFRRTIPCWTLASTNGGMRRILKKKDSYVNYLRKAVDSGVYRTRGEIDKVRKQRRESADSLGEVMDRFRQDIVRGASVMDYPHEYFWLQMHPPIPDPPKMHKMLKKNIRRNREFNPTERLVKQYLQRQQFVDAAANKVNTEAYYRRLLGVPAPSLSSGLGQKSVLVQKAYAAAVLHYQLERTQGLSDDEAMQQVDAILAEQVRHEQQISRERVQEAKHVFGAKQRQERAAAAAETNTPNNTEQKLASAKSDSSEPELALSPDALDAIPSFFNNNPLAIKAMMIWSKRLEAVPYQEWTIGASTALDHWIARQVLDVSELSWLACLQSSDNDPVLLATGRDIVAVRETLFPETRLGPALPDDDDEWMEQQQHDEDESAEQESSEKSIDELLATLGGLSSSRFPTSKYTLLDDDDKDAKITQLVEQLQEWRRLQQETPYETWSKKDQKEFSAWLQQYVATVWSDSSRGNKVDYDATRDALLAVPPTTAAQADAFWRPLQDERNARQLLDEIRRHGPPPGASFLQQGFWDLPYEDQLQRLLSLGAIRPLVDEYATESDRLRFVQRHADALLEGVELEHLVPDPDGPIRALDLPEGMIRMMQDSFQTSIPPNARFRLELRPYQSVGPTGENQVSSDEKTRFMFQAWNEHKAGRARYEEKMFQKGRLGLRYRDKVPREEDYVIDYEDDDEDEDD